MNDFKKNVMMKYVLSAMVLILCVSCGSTGDGNMKTSKKDMVMENIFLRKSVRDYTDQEVSKETLELLVKAGMAAPSGKNIQPWSFVIVSDRNTLDKMAEGLPYAKMLKKARHAIIVCGDVEKSSYWYLDCSAASQNILLAIEAMGLGGVWTAAYPYDDRIQVVRDAISLPENIIPLNVIPVGHPKGMEKAKDKWDAEKVHWDKY